ncbi:hypothetical protein TWF191_002142 [Orbilia oligospora]|uniref:Uncharacterized protein n=1 Tax=Orbilia oligospora TaxID=2813651 RepID=A0A7C8UW35_ORBOL|nr:hypothetical protein TWF191_002142 [Orbilia oligospora]
MYVLIGLIAAAVSNQNATVVPATATPASAAIVPATGPKKASASASKIEFASGPQKVPILELRRTLSVEKKKSTSTRPKKASFLGIKQASSSRPKKVPAPGLKIPKVPIVDADETVVLRGIGVDDRTRRLVQAAKTIYPETPAKIVEEVTVDVARRLQESSTDTMITHASSSVIDCDRRLT